MRNILHYFFIFLIKSGTRTNNFIKPSFLLFLKLGKGRETKPNQNLIPNKHQTNKYPPLKPKQTNPAPLLNPEISTNPQQQSAASLELFLFSNLFVIQTLCVDASSSDSGKHEAREVRTNLWFN